jgi:hypothetical protein
MSTRHRVALALERGARITDFEHSTFQDGNTVNYVFRDPDTARIISEMLRAIFKSSRPQLIHNGGKP